MAQQGYLPLMCIKDDNSFKMSLERLETLIAGKPGNFEIHSLSAKRTRQGRCSWLVVFCNAGGLPIPTTQTKDAISKIRRNCPPNCQRTEAGYYSDGTFEGVYVVWKYEYCNCSIFDVAASLMNPPGEGDVEIGLPDWKGSISVITFKLNEYHIGMFQMPEAVPSKNSMALLTVSAASIFEWLFVTTRIFAERYCAGAMIGTIGVVFTGGNMDKVKNEFGAFIETIQPEAIIEMLKMSTWLPEEGMDTLELYLEYEDAQPKSFPPLEGVIFQPHGEQFGKFLVSFKRWTVQRYANNEQRPGFPTLDSPPNDQ